MSSQPEDGIAQQIGRLLAMFDPPEAANEEQEKIFLRELRIALAGFHLDSITDGITWLIANRKHKRFPAVGEICAAIKDRLPTPKTSPDMSQVFANDDDKRAKALDFLLSLPLAKRQRIVADNAQVRVFDFIVAHDRLPDGNDYRQLLEEGVRVQRLLDEVATPPDSASSTFKHITWKAAEAIRHRRAHLAEKLLGKQAEAAE